MVKTLSIELINPPSSRSKRTKFIVLFSVLVVLLLSAVGVGAGFLYRHFKKSKPTDDTKIIVLDSKDVLPHHDLNDVKDLYPSEDKLNTRDNGLEHEDKSLIIDVPVVKNDFDVNNDRILEPNPVEDKPAVVPDVKNDTPEDKDKIVKPNLVEDKPAVVPDVKNDAPEEDRRILKPNLVEYTPLVLPDVKNDSPEDKDKIVKPKPVEDKPIVVPVVDTSDRDRKEKEKNLKEQERLRQLEEEKIKERKRIEAINRKFEEEEKKKKEKNLKPKEQEKKKIIEPKIIDKKPNVVTPKSDDRDFQSELDKLLKERIDRSKEVNKVLKEAKDLKQEDQTDKMDELTPKVVVVSGKEAIFERLNGFAAKKGIAVVKGEFEDCIIGRCKPPRDEHVFEWELKLIAEIMDEAKKPFDLKYEFETIKLYRAYGKKFKRFYFTKEGIKESYTTFRITRDKIEKHNKNPKRMYSMDFTIFSDMGEEMEILHRPAMNKEKISSFSRGSKNLRDQVIHIDWREKGIVQPVIHQGSCGSCWAVAATDVFNSFAAKNSKEKVRYSHQQLVDCVSPKYNCSRGGSQFVALQYIRDNKMCTDKDYPYVSQKNQCSSYKCEKESGIKDIVNLARETALDFLKDNGPFLTFLNCTSDFLLYSDGIFDGRCGGKNAHSVVVVGHGYDSTLNKNYWIVKNSWGEEWGEDGYVRVLDEQTDPTNPSKVFCDFLEYSHGII